MLSGLTLDYFFVKPYLSITIGTPVHLLALVLYVLNAILVSIVVDQAARRSRSAQRAQAESQLLATITGSVFRGQDALQALVSRTKEAFSLSGVRLMSQAEVIFAEGDLTDARMTSVATGDRGTLELYGGDLQASERRLLSVIAAQIDAALEYRELSATAKEIGPLTENDRMRSALLAAVGHDLRRPLAAATAAVTGLRSTGITWSETDRDELLATAEESLESLSALVTNLLDVSRLQAGFLAVSSTSIDVAEVVLPALDELGLGPGDVELDLPRDLPPIIADPGLLQRVVVNLLDNAMRYSPPGHPARISASTFAGMVEIRIVDEGPGVPHERREEIFVPFQRLGDTDNLTGLGLGLALSKGFTEGMGGTLEAEETPGGGLSMVISLPAIENSDRG